MNIFLLSETNCPIESAEMSCDVHSRKMCIEQTQLLANLFSPDLLATKDCPRTQSGEVRKHSHINHPCDIWTKKSSKNVDWLITHARALFKEYTFRYKKRHFTEDFLDWIENNKKEIKVPHGETTSFPIAIAADKNCRKTPGFNDMPRFEQYRLYYIHDKPFSKWEKGRNVPNWFKRIN